MRFANEEDKKNLSLDMQKPLNIILSNIVAKNRNNEKINTKYAHAMQLIKDSSEIDRESFDKLENRQKIRKLLNLRPEQLAILSMQEREDLDNLKQQDARDVQAKRDYQHKFNNDLYTDAITKVLEKNNISIDVFNGLSAHKKTTLLLRLTEQDRKELPVQEQQALVQLQEKRKEELQLHKEQFTKRSTQTSRENIVDSKN